MSHDEARVTRPLRSGTGIPLHRDHAAEHRQAAATRAWSDATPMIHDAARAHREIVGDRNGNPYDDTPPRRGSRFL